MTGLDDAFPTPKTASSGLTKREYFAASALSALVANGVSKADVAGFAVVIADELIDALNQVKP